MAGCDPKDTLPLWIDAIASARDRLHRLTADGQLTCGTADRYLRAFEGFTRYAQSSGVDAPDPVTSELCRGYIFASSRCSGRPSASTSRVRLAALREAYRGLMAKGICAVDPTADLAVPPAGGSAPSPNPLTPPEVDRLRKTGRLRPTDTLRPAVVAAALAGGSQSEVAHLAVADFDTSQGSLHFGRNTCQERVVPLEGPSLPMLQARVRHLEGLSDR